MHRCRLLACPSVLVVLHFVVHLFSGRLFAVILHCVTFSCCFYFVVIHSFWGRFRFCFHFAYHRFFMFLSLFPQESSSSSARLLVSCRLEFVVVTTACSKLLAYLLRSSPSLYSREICSLLYWSNRGKKRKSDHLKTKKEKIISIYNKI